MRPLLKYFFYSLIAAVPAFSQSPLAITTTFLPNGTVQVSYSADVQSTGGIGTTRTWSILSGSLPPGLNISGSGATATIGGTPTTSGNYSFTVLVVDERQQRATQPLSIFVNPPALTIITTSPLPDATVSVNYNYNFTQSSYTTGLPFIPNLGVRGDI